MERNEFDSTKDDSDRFFNGERSEYYSDNSIGIWVIVSDEMLLATNYAECTVVMVHHPLSVVMLTILDNRSLKHDGCSCAEAGQLLTALWVGFTFRHVNIDDILLNIIGVLLGYGVFKIFRNVFQWGYKKLETNSNAFLSYIKCVCDDNSDALLK